MELQKRDWDTRMFNFRQQHPYFITIPVHTGFGSYNVFEPSKFPQRYPEYDRVVADVFQEWKKKQTLRQCRAIKEELMMTCWHPDRLEKMLEQGYEFD